MSNNDHISEEDLKDVTSTVSDNKTEKTKGAKRRDPRLITISKN